MRVNLLRLSQKFGLWAIACLLLAFAPGALATPAQDRVLYHQPLQLLDVATGRTQSEKKSDDDDSDRDDDGNALAPLSFDAFGKRFHLTLRENPMLNHYRSSDRYSVLRGELEGLPGSWLRLLKDGPRLSGMFFDGQEFYVIEPRDQAGDRLVQPELTPGSVNVIYRLRDVLLPAGVLNCTAVPPKIEVSGAEAMDSLLDEVAALPRLQAQGATRRITLGAVADYDLLTAWGTETESRILARINVVDGIFSEQLALNVSLQELDIATDSNDGFTKTAATDLLDEVTSYRQANQTQFGLTHLFTGKNLDGNTRGIAWLGGACRSLFGAALSQQVFSSLTTGALTTAHEIGHNLGALHDGEISDDPRNPNPCDSVPQGYLMWPTIGASSDFSQCSLNRIEAFLASSTAACVETVGPDGIDFSGLELSLTIASGELRTLDFDVINTGATEISNARLDISLPNELTLNAATPGCDLTSGSLSACLLGNIIGGGTVPVSLEFTSNYEGSYVVTLSLTNSELPDIINRSVTINISSVTATATTGGSGSGGGGGGLGLISLTGLIAVALRRRSHHTSTFE